MDDAPWPWPQLLAPLVVLLLLGTLLWVGRAVGG
jgi:hypothetical protein